MAAAMYKVDESQIKNATRLLAVLNAQLGDVYQTLDDISKILPRRSQRFERSCDALYNKGVLLQELIRGLTISGELPEFHAAEPSK